MDVKLVMFKANGQRRDFPVVGDSITIGRGTECQLQIPLGTVSRKHCELDISDDGVTVRDLGSSNGTFVNDSRVQEAQLNAGDRLAVGPVIFIVSIDGEPEEIKPVRTVIVEQSVEPVSHQDEGEGTIDAEAEVEVEAQNPLAALQAMSKPKKK